METEAITDIVREMREMPCDLIVDANANFVFRRYADRIEAAHQREVEQLRRALKPVLDCHLCDGGTQVVSDALCAIREAKEVMKGETK